jgi:hypothetical protein
MDLYLHNVVDVRHEKIVMDSGRVVHRLEVDCRPSRGADTVYTEIVSLFENKDQPLVVGHRDGI